MKGIVFAGGKGTRLHPLTKKTNKHLIPVGNEPMIMNPIRKLVEAGIRDILITTNPEDVDKFEALLRNKEDLDVTFTYRAQSESNGTGNALLLGEEFADNQKIVVVCGDNITTGSLKPYIENFSRQEKGAHIILKKVKNPHQFGIATIQDGKIIKTEEKPKDSSSDLAITGYLMFNPDVFNIAKNLKLSVRGEYEMTDIYKEYMERGELKYEIFNEEWIDAGTFESLSEANELLLKAAKNRPF